MHLERWQYHSLVDFQLSVKSDSIPFLDICAKSAKCYTGFRSSGCNPIINVYCSGECFPGRFIYQQLAIFVHSQ